ncbi:MAG: hypothetical protein FWG89_08145 [Treponema sp.]|nr:hypothetical protein [Treponema sp.]
MKTKVAALLTAVILLASVIIACDEFLLTELIPDNSVIVTFIIEEEFDVDPIDPIVLEKGETLGELLPIIDDPLFLGWFEGLIQYTGNSEILADITLTAKFDTIGVTGGGGDGGGGGLVEVTFDLNYDNRIATVVELSSGGSIGSRFPFDPRRQGFSFNGWRVDGQPFTRETEVTESVTAIAAWTAKAVRTVTLVIPGPHAQHNASFGGTTSGTGANMTRTRTVQVFDGDGIDEWGPQFPETVTLAADPNANQYYRFFRWSVGGTASGLIYDGRTPITENVTLRPYIGLNLHPRTWTIDLSTRLTSVQCRTPVVQNITYVAGNAATGVRESLTVTFHASPSFLCFQTPSDLRTIIALGSPDLDTQLRWEIEYELQDPTRETTDLLWNFMVANLAQNDNWNAVSVDDLTLPQINGNPDEGTEGTIHTLAGTHSSHSGANRNWYVIRGGRGGEVAKGSVRITFYSIKFHILQ